MPLAAAEMVLVRLAYVADLPSPAELIRQLRAAARRPAAGRPPASGGRWRRIARHGGRRRPSPRRRRRPGREPAPQRPVARAGVRRCRRRTGCPNPETLPRRRGAARREREGSPVLVSSTAASIWSASSRAGSSSADGRAPRELSAGVGKLLTEWTGRRWLVTVVGRAAASRRCRAGRSAKTPRRWTEVAQHPVVRAVLDAFPGAAFEVRDVADRSRSDGDACGRGRRHRLRREPRPTWTIQENSKP